MGNKEQGRVVTKYTQVWCLKQMTSFVSNLAVFLFRGAFFPVGNIRLKKNKVFGWL